MTGRTVTATVEWALHGKTAGGEGSRILACSSGRLGKTNFADAVSRFQLGALAALPQVSMSYLQAATQPEGSYLALAVHWSAKEGQSFADGNRLFDNLGRDAAFTSYFCVPYHPLAAATVTYQDLKAAYSGGLDRAAILQILADGPHPPTSALFGAVVLHLSRPKDWRLARDAYAHGSLTLMSVDQPTSGQLRDGARAFGAVTTPDSTGNSAEAPSPVPRD
jgi:hypothetical protein